MQLPTPTTLAVQNGSQFIKNLAANLLTFGLSMLIAVWYTPYLIRHLGIGAYGLVPLAATVASCLSLTTIALNGPVGRFLTIALDRQGSDEANRIFNTALFGNVFIACLFLVPAVAISWHVGNWFNVPPGNERALSWLFFCLICSLFVAMIGSSFSIASYCRNRFDLSNMVDIASNCFRVGTVVVLFNCFVPEVWHVGIGAILAVLFSTAGSIIIWRRLTPTLQIQLSSFDLPTLRSLMALGGWLFVSQLGAFLFLGIDLIVVNKLLGAQAGGRYGAVLQWPILLRTLAGAIAGVFGPTIMMLYGRQDTAGLVRYSRQAVKFLSLTMSLPIGVICGFSSALLLIWLGPEFEPLAPLMSLMTIHLAVNLCVLPLFNIHVAAKRVRVPGIVTCTAGVVNIGVAVLLAGPIGWGMYGVAAANAFVLTSVNLLFRPWYTAHILGIPNSTFFRGALPQVCATLGLTAVCWVVSHYLEIESWLGLGLAAGAVSVVYLAFVFAAMLTQSEREAALAVLRRFQERISFFR